MKKSILGVLLVLVMSTLFLGAKIDDEVIKMDIPSEFVFTDSSEDNDCIIYTYNNITDYDFEFLQVLTTKGLYDDLEDYSDSEIIDVFNSYLDNQYVISDAEVSDFNGNNLKGKKLKCLIVDSGAELICEFYIAQHSKNVCELVYMGINDCPSLDELHKCLDEAEWNGVFPMTLAIILIIAFILIVVILLFIMKKKNNNFMTNNSVQTNFVGNSELNENSQTLNTAEPNSEEGNTYTGPEIK